jgi:hypothetical protein
LLYSSFEKALLTLSGLDKYVIEKLGQDNASYMYGLFASLLYFLGNLA